MGLKIKILSFLLISFLFFNCGEKRIEEKGLVVKDDIGNEIKLKTYPKRIISSAPNITEIIYAIDAQELLVGRTSFCNYPEDVKRIPVVGDMLNLNFERIVELQPDLIIMTVEGNTKETFDKLKTLGIQVYVTNPRDINGILKSIKALSIILNKKDTAEVLLKFFSQKLEQIRMQNLKEQTVMFVVSLVPLIVAGHNTFINDLLNVLKLKNISPNSTTAYPILSREEVMKKNPDWIILPSGYTMEEILRSYPEWKKLDAVRKQKIIFVNPDLFFRPGPRFIDAIEFLMGKIQF
ncbi:MAG: cobalamin-binding protein [Ignavibacteria bacterium]|nr:cobalamin-binding protein [Ignavibacteria bacterium]